MIETHNQRSALQPGFSILIPSWNNLAYLKLCIASILKNSSFPHQIIIHVNEGSDGSRQWVQDQKLDFTCSKENIGICKAVNFARTLVRTDYIVYMNDDMYVCPGWDLELWKEIADLKTRFFFLSSTMLEPYPTASTPVIAPCNYGTTAETFDEAALLSEFMRYDKSDWSGASRPPNIVHKDIWDLVGGYSVEFSPGAYSDPDFSMKLWHAGVRHFKGIGNSRVYHFVSKSLHRTKMNNGRRQFLRKWGITSSTLEKHYLKLGKPYNGACSIDYEDSQYRSAVLKNKLQRLFQWPASGDFP